MSRSTIKQAQTTYLTPAIPAAALSAPARSSCALFAALAPAENGIAEPGRWLKGPPASTH